MTDDNSLVDPIPPQPDLEFVQTTVLAIHDITTSRWVKQYALQVSHVLQYGNENGELRGLIQTVDDTSGATGARILANNISEQYGWSPMLLEHPNPEDLKIAREKKMESLAARIDLSQSEPAGQRFRPFLQLCEQLGLNSCTCPCAHTPRDHKGGKCNPYSDLVRLDRTCLSSNAR